MSLLEAQPACEMTPAEFGVWLARRRGRAKPYTGEIVRQWIKNGLPASRGARGFVIAEPDRAHAWWAANRGESVHGGERDGAGRKGGGTPPPSAARTPPPSVTGEGAERDGRRDAAHTGEGADHGAELTGISRVKFEKLDVETRLKELDYEVKLGQLIRRDEAAEGTSRVLSVVVRELTRLPDRVTDTLAERLRLASAERAALRDALAGEVEEVRRWIAEHPLGEEGEGTGGGTSPPPGRAL